MAVDRTAILGYATDQETNVLDAVEWAETRSITPENYASGLNLLTHGSFESAEGWTVGAGWFVPQLVTDAYHEDAVARCIAFGAPGELVSAPITVDPIAESYFVSFLSRMVSHVHGLAQVLVRAYDAAGEIVEEWVIVEYASDMGYDWTPFSQQFAPVIEEERDFDLPYDAVAIRLVFRAAENAEMVWEIDAAQVTPGWLDSTFSPKPNEMIDGSAILDGTLPPAALDTTPPAIPANLTLTTDAILGSDGTAISKVHAALTHPTDSDYSLCEIQITDDFSQSNPADPATRIPLWAPARTFNLPKDAERVTLEPAVGGAPYWARARSLDVTGNRSAWCDAVLLPAAMDGDAPPIPVINQTIRGFKSVGVWWNPVEAPDLSHYEVRWRQKPTVVEIEGGGTEITVQEWTRARSKATVVVATGLDATDIGPDPLEPEYTYYTFQVRAIDLTGNVREGRTLNMLVAAAAIADAALVVVADGRGVLPGSTIVFEGDATQYSVRAVVMNGPTEATLTVQPGLLSPLVIGAVGVNAFDSFVPMSAETYVDAGWSVPVIDYALLVGQSDIAANSILANMIVAGEITAGLVTTPFIIAEEMVADDVIVNRHLKSYEITAIKIATSGLDADQIKAGMLTLGGPDPEDPEDPTQRTNPHILLVLDPEGNPIAKIGTLRGLDSTPPGTDVPAEVRGILFLDPAHPSRKVMWADGTMSFTDDDWAHIGVAIDGRGIIADSIQVGTAPGGHNAFPNPSYERTPVVGAPNTKEWTATTDWDDFLTGHINTDESGADLKMDSVTY